MTERRPLILRADTALPRLQELPVGDLLPTDTLGNAIKVLLQGLVTGNNAGITSTDTVLEAFGKLQAQTSAKVDKDGAKVLSDNNFTNAERVKLANVAENASANSSDAFLLNRSNHSGPLNWAWSTYGGTANAITLTPAYARSAYVVGDEFRFRAIATNTGATTINVGGLGVKAAVTVTGAALPAGYIRTDVDTFCVYDGTSFVMQREVEYGSNANGSFIKSANGVLDCYCTNQNVAASNVFGAVFGSDLVNFTFPVAFSATPKIVPLSNSSGGWAISSTPTTSAVGLFAISPLTGTSVLIGCAANGRWY
ncbi:hypothetical protein [Comamonas thiooxydans]|uniref:hypothetical protein n=1 Tax=Comamonas thiooxydans TaxID=363952 RepID=UPI0015A73DB2|nr:hypothetical protein [Comamonas thiooxydans]